MSRFSRLKQAWPFSKTVSLETIGAPATVEALKSALDSTAKAMNKYEMYRTFLNSDPELNNAITRLALLTSYAYRGPFLRVGTTLTDREKEIQKNAEKEAYDLDFRGKFFTISRHLLRDGDDIWVGNFDDTVGLNQLQPLPIELTTILTRKEQSGTSENIIERKYYVVNETVATKEQMFPENDNQRVFHFAVDNDAEIVYDIRHRFTFGVWSISPMECLRTEILWKKAIKITDILWRYRNVPREKHTLDTSMFSPDKFPGANWAEQVSNATLAAQNYLREYASEISKKKVDQGYVVGSNVKDIAFVEPEKMTYSSPNDILDQINRSIREGIGAYEIGKGTYATELVTSSYVVLMPDLLAYRIKRELLRLLKLHLSKKYKYSEEELAPLDIRLSLVLDILKGELVRQTAVMAATGAFTVDEIREHVNKEPLTDEQKAQLVNISKGEGGRTGQNAQTLNDIAAIVQRQDEPTEPITPQSRAQKQAT